MLVQLIYVSIPTTPTADAVPGIVFSAQEFNQSAGISGMLISSPNFYVQMLEGERVAVSELFSKIAKDPRHKCVTIVRYAEVRTREFADWSLLHVTFAELKSHFVATVVKQDDITPELLSGVRSLALIRRLAVLVRISSEVQAYGSPHNLIPSKSSDTPQRRKTDLHYLVPAG